MGSLVPEISLSVMMTWESSVSHSPGPSCGVEMEVSRAASDPPPAASPKTPHTQGLTPMKKALPPTKGQPGGWLRVL